MVGLLQTRRKDVEKYEVQSDYSGIGLKEVEAEEIDGAYVAAIKQFGCRLEDILAVGPCVTVGEYLKQAKGKSDA